MGLDLGAVGRTTDPVTISWRASDVLLYNLAVGAGQTDPLAELDLTTENSEGVTLRPVPSFVVSLVQANAPRPDAGELDRTALVHGEQSFALAAPLPAEGSAVVVTTISGIHDQGSGALIHVETTLTDPGTGALLGRTRMGSFLRGAGGFGGERAPRSAWQVPTTPPDLEQEIAVRADQALLYRLCGDRTPLHSDPVFARRAGFDRPILHGLCTLGMTCRVLDAISPVLGMSTRFVRPVVPGGRLRIRSWHGHGFQVVDEKDDLVLDQGITHDRKQDR